MLPEQLERLQKSVLRRPCQRNFPPWAGLGGLPAVPGCSQLPPGSLWAVPRVSAVPCGDLPADGALLWNEYLPTCCSPGTKARLFYPNIYLPERLPFALLAEPAGDTLGVFVPAWGWWGRRGGRCPGIATGAESCPFSRQFCLSATWAP